MKEFEGKVRKKKKVVKHKEENDVIISIITPYYNCQEYIEETAKSVLSQTFPFFEWIIVDDGSFAAGIKKLRKIEKLDERIKVYYRPKDGNKRTSCRKRFWNRTFCKRIKIYCFFRCR